MEQPKPLESVQLDAEQFSFEKAVGGWKGALDSIGPALVFIIVYIVSYNLKYALIAAIAVAVVSTVWRLVEKTSLKQVAIGFIGVIIAVIWAWKTGQPKDFFAFGLWINAVYGGVILLTIVLRMPIVGLLVAAVHQRLGWWKTKDVAAKIFYRRSFYATWVWVGLFAIRLIVEVPMYYLNWVGALGVARLVLGVPLFALAAWLTWVMMKTVTPLLKRSGSEEL